MIRKILRTIREKTERKIREKEKQILVKKVERGTDFVISEYGPALRKLGAYDKQ